MGLDLSRPELRLAQQVGMAGKRREHGIFNIYSMAAWIVVSPSRRSLVFVSPIRRFDLVSSEMEDAENFIGAGPCEPRSGHACAGDAANSSRSISRFSRRSRLFRRTCADRPAGALPCGSRPQSGSSSNSRCGSAGRRLCEAAADDHLLRFCVQRRVARPARLYHE